MRLTLKRGVATTRITLMTRWLVGLVIVASSLAHAREIPPAPRWESYTWDDAGLIGSADESRLHGLQLDALNRYNSPLVVVTIGSMSEYGESSIETLARRWFDQWNIGTLGLERGANQGMLLLVAVQDRRARIELGADWGHGWDAHAKTIMDDEIVPRFKKGDYPGGIVAGAEAMLEMAKKGPHSQPPGDFLNRVGSRYNSHSLLDGRFFMICMGVGVLLVLLGVFGPESSRKLLIITGIGLILFAAFTYAVLLVLFVLFGGRGRGGGRSRGFSGGYSGGGGASGSW